MKASVKGAFLLVLIVVTLSACQVTLRHETVESIEHEQGLVVLPANVSDQLAGLRYVLPKTALRFCVVAEKVEKKRGAFYLYSERYLGLKDVILEDEVEWTIKSVEMSEFGVPSGNQFVVSPSVSQAPLFSLSETGLLLGINEQVPEPENKLAVIATKEVESVVPYTEEMLLANSTAKMAQEAARYIYQLRESKAALISSDVTVAPADGQALELSVREINALEDQFVSLFSGAETRTCVRQTIEVVPEKMDEKMILFRFSSFNGMVDKTDLSGSPVYLEINEEFRPEPVVLPDTAGLYFAQPAKVNVKLYDGRQQILSESVSMAQFGVINCLPKGYLTEEVKMRFYPSTGAIKAIYRK